MTNYLTLDIGGSAIKYALMDESFRICEEGIRQGTPSTRTEFIEAVGEIYDSFADRIEGLAISSCGEIDPESGWCYSGGTLAYNSDTNLKESIQARCAKPVSIENDANCALLAEVSAGALTGCRDAMVLVIGTGVGGALMINGKLYRGSHFYAGSVSIIYPSLSGPFGFGHMVMGQAGVGGLIGPYALALPQTGTISGAGTSTDAGIDGRTFFARLAEGDPIAQLAFDQYCEGLAALVYNLQCVLDLDAVAIGGGVSAQPSLVTTIRQKLDDLYSLMFLPVPRADVRACHHRNYANLRGALVHHLQPEL